MTIKNLYSRNHTLLCLRHSNHSSICSLYTLQPHKEKPTTWNTSHTLVLSNPLLSTLERCISMKQLKQIQTQMVLTSLINDPFASSRLIAFCAISDSGCLNYSKFILRNVENVNVFSWNVTIRGNLEKGESKEAIMVYKEMLRFGFCCSPDHYTYPLVLKGCAQIGVINIGYQVINHVMKKGLEKDLFVFNTTISMFIACGRLMDARRLFDESRHRDLVSWNTMINGYVKGGMDSEALRLFKEMCVQEVRPDYVTLIAMVSSCAQTENSRLGEEFHRYIKEDGMKVAVPLCNALMDMYVKCGNLEPARVLFNGMSKKTLVSYTTMIVGYMKFGLLDSARKLFKEIPEKDVVPWNALISGYVQRNRGNDAIALFREMQHMGVKPDEVTMVCLLSTSSLVGALDVGEWIHSYIKEHNIHINDAVCTALVDMYAKCGNITKADEVFQELHGRNALTWTAMINGLALNGDYHGAVTYFLEMINIGLVPDEVTFIAVLSTCCHAGLVNEGRDFFTQMSSKYNISPQVRHYSCMVDLLGRAGFLDEAEKLITSMPMKPDVGVWGALFFSCRTYGDVIIGERAAEKLLELDPHDSATYVLLANMYTEANMSDKARNVRMVMKDRGLDKNLGFSSIGI